MYLPALQSGLWWHTHCQLWPWGSKELWAGQQSSDPGGRQPCQPLKGRKDRVMLLPKAVHFLKKTKKISYRHFAQCFKNIFWVFLPSPPTPTPQLSSRLWLWVVFSKELRNCSNMCLIPRPHISHLGILSDAILGSDFVFSGELKGSKLRTWLSSRCGVRRAAESVPSVPSGSACSSRCFCLNFMFP